MIRRFFVAVAVVFGSMGLVSLATPSAPVYAAKCTGGALLTLPPWYKGLDCEADGGVTLGDSEDKIQKSVTQIILNVIEILTQLVGYASIVFIIIGGFRYMTSAGSPQSMTAARKTIFNAIIGLLIAIFAVTIINLIGAAL